MVHWVYVVECEDGYIYVGETIKLYRRFNQHQTGRGGTNTSKHSPEKLIGLYKVAENDSFSNYRGLCQEGEYNRFIFDDWGIDQESGKLDVENHITEMYFYLRGNGQERFPYNDKQWQKIRGGKYTRDIITANPTNSMNNVMDRPLCNCGYPSEVKKAKDKNFIYFVCPLKNVWDDFYDDIEVEEACDFWKPYEEDVYVKKQFEINQKRLKESWCENLPTAFAECIKCKNIQYTMLYSHGARRQICQNCFSNKYEELKAEYSISKYMFMDD